MLAHLHLTFQHRAGVRPYTSIFIFAESCVFGKQSPPPFKCHLLQVALGRYPFSRSYRVNLPSSLTMDHSSALGYSPRLPVSVYGTGCLKLQRLEAFLGNKFTNTIYSSKPKQYYQVSAQGTDLPIPLITYTLQRTIPSVRGCFTIPSLHHYLKQVSEY